MKETNGPCASLVQKLRSQRPGRLTSAEQRHLKQCRDCRDRFDEATRRWLQDGAAGFAGHPAAVAAPQHAGNKSLRGLAAWGTAIAACLAMVVIWRAGVLSPADPTTILSSPQPDEPLVAMDHRPNTAKPAVTKRALPQLKARPTPKRKPGTKKQKPRPIRSFIIPDSVLTVEVKTENPGAPSGRIVAYAGSRGESIVRRLASSGEAVNSSLMEIASPNGHLILQANTKAQPALENPKP